MARLRIGLGAMSFLRGWEPYVGAYVAAAAVSYISPPIAIGLCIAVSIWAALRDSSAALLLLVLQLPLDRLFHLREQDGMVLLAAQMAIQVGSVIWRKPTLRRELVHWAFWRQKLQSGGWLLISAYCGLAVLDSSSQVSLSFRLMTLVFAGAALCVFTLYDGRFSARDRSALTWALILGLLLQLVADKAFMFDLLEVVLPPQTLDFDPVINGRLMGLTINANQLAEFCLAAFSFAYASFVRGKGGHWHWWRSLLLMALFYAGVADSLSKGAIGASLAVMALFAVAQSIKRFDSQALRSIAALALSFVVFVGVAIVPAMVQGPRPAAASESAPAPPSIAKPPTSGQPSEVRSAVAQTSPPPSAATRTVWYQAYDRQAGRTGSEPARTARPDAGKAHGGVISSAPVAEFVQPSRSGPSEPAAAEPTVLKQAAVKQIEVAPTVLQQVEARQAETKAVEAAASAGVALQAAENPAARPALEPVSTPRAAVGSAIAAASKPQSSRPRLIARRVGIPPLKSSPAPSGPRLIRVSAPLPVRAVALPPPQPAIQAPVAADSPPPAEANALQRRLRLGIETAPVSDLARKNVHFSSDAVCQGICGGMRSELWQAGWRVVKTHWLLGFGFGGWRFQLQPLLGYAYSSPHDVVLHLWGMFGLAGLGLALSSWVLLASRALRHFLAPAGSVRARTWVLASTFFLLVIAGHELIETSFILSLSRSGLLCWLMLAMQGGAFRPADTVTEAT